MESYVDTVPPGEVGAESYGNWLVSQAQPFSKGRQLRIGIAYQGLNVHGYGTPLDYQKTVLNYGLVALGYLRQLCGRPLKSKINILRDFDGLVQSGEMLLVIGRPGSGCTTLLKTLSGRTRGIFVDPASQINYQGFSKEVMYSDLRGECGYQAESEVHFPHLTLNETLLFVAKARLPPDYSMINSAKDNKDAVAAALDLSSAMETKVGNDFIRGLSGGERQRTALGEVLLCSTSIQCWDNSTRGLDSSNALNFIKVLRSSSTITGSTHIVTMYQASQDIVDVFDKIAVLFEGYQIFFGKVNEAESYFASLGFTRPKRTTTSDFITSITKPAEWVHLITPGHEGKVPRTASEFAATWAKSDQRAKLLKEIKAYNLTFQLEMPSESPHQKSQESTTQGHRSPYTVSFRKQIILCFVRGLQRLVNDISPPVSAIVGNAIISIILGSMFYNMPNDTSSFFGRGVLIFFTVLTNTFLGAFEGVQLWEQRPIVEKHFQYALYRPTAEAISSMICDLPNKILLTTFFNIPFYFLSNMRRTPGAFLTFYLFSFSSLLTGSMLFRAIGAISTTVTGSIAPGANFVLMFVVYTGFVIPIPNMHPWFRWFNYLNPVGYTFESLMLNEFSGREFSCASFVPEGPSYSAKLPDGRMCATVGARIGSNVVLGDDYLASSFQYAVGHLWRNFGIILLIMAFLCTIYLLAIEYVATKQSKGEVLVFRRGHVPRQKLSSDEEFQATQAPHSYNKQDDTLNDKSIPVPAKGASFLWDNLSYDLKTKAGTKRVLDDVEGWIKPGTLTALMGPSGAGKTTLLNVLANRTTTGVITGSMLTDSTSQDVAFARRVGYAQQEDIHLAASTVREALIFSARLRQPRQYSDSEKLNWVDQLIVTLDMSSFAEAVIGVPGEGLNFEQRKRVTIGVELAARPELLLFLDEPTSGLDSNTAWSICTLLKKLAREGQDILCTIHQPSNTLFEMFDRLLLLCEGKTAYFGELGDNSRILIDYFTTKGAPVCDINQNPAEWLLNVISNSRTPWTDIWRDSLERKEVKEKLALMTTDLSNSASSGPRSTSDSGEFATSFIHQLYMVTRRNLELDWRNPSYMYSKFFLALGTGLLNGFSFYQAENSLQGVQNQIFSVFILLSLHGNLVQLFMPHFLTNREIYEIRESPSRTYSWMVFVLSNIIAEIPWVLLLAVVQFVTWYYAVGFNHNASATNQTGERGLLMFLTVASYLMFSSTFSQMLGTIMPDAATGINISSLLYSLSLIFGGILVPADQLPKFWKFMYYSTPVTYFVKALVSAGLAGAEITCAANEIIQVNPPNGSTCAVYLQEYISNAGGNLLNPGDTINCRFCRVSHTDTLLQALGIEFSQRWRDFGITAAYSGINVILALALYWLLRVPKKTKPSRKISL